MNDDENEENIQKFKRFFVIEGRQVFDFVQAACLKNLHPTCQIDGHKTSVYKLPSTGDFLCVTEDMDLDASTSAVELLMPWLKNAEQTYVFTVLSQHLHNTTEPVSDKRCFVRTISNSEANVSLNCLAPMEDCNIITAGGISAGGKAMS